MSFFRNVISNYADARDRKSFSYLYTAVIGLGFFTTAITWSMFNIYVPVYLDSLLGHLDNAKLIIGIIMVLDNIAAITLQPWIGKVSDNIWTKFGRRMPFILAGIPIAALFFGLIPTFKDSLVLIIIIIGGFNISMALYRAPVVALMPDLVSKEYRSRGNAVINLLGGVGALIGLFVMGAIYDPDNPIITFVIASVVMVLCLVVLYFNIKEPKERVDVEEKEKVSLLDAIRNMFKDKDKSLIFILLAILFWFFAFNAIETWFSLYATDPNLLNMTEGSASMLLGVYSLTFIIFAIPAGLIAKKIGRKKTIIIGLIGLISVMIPLVILSIVRVPALSEFIGFLPFKWTWEILIDGVLLFLGGMFWAFININSIVIVWELAGTARLGTYTGLYYFFSALAAIVSPVMAGAIFDASNISFLFLYSSIFFVAALVCTLFIQRTGSEDDDKILAK
ncbi:MAG: SLC45 family MFS transporter [Candidatus Heimdallarchaeota archaeon]|nr:SLC45 family MFS transporter [Candidatus Heimdallarchaeota archaeon]